MVNAADLKSASLLVRVQPDEPISGGSSTEQSGGHISRGLRVQIPPAGLIVKKVSAHATRRYCERKKVMSVTAAEASIRELLKDAQELELKKRYRTAEVLNHRDQARFFRACGLVFVVVHGNVATCHAGTAKRWKRMEKKA